MCVHNRKHVLASFLCIGQVQNCCASFKLDRCPGGLEGGAAITAVRGAGQHLSGPLGSPIRTRQDFVQATRADKRGPGKGVSILDCVLAEPSLL
jgi:hypothetical protein